MRMGPRAAHSPPGALQTRWSTPRTSPAPTATSAAFYVNSHTWHLLRRIPLSTAYQQTASHQEPARIFHLHTWEEFSKMPDPEWLIADILPESTVSMVFGDGGS